MSQRFTIGMLMLHFGTPRDRAAREQLAAALPQGSAVGEPDEVGAFDVEVDAEDLEGALHRVWNAVAASGADDHIVFLEHPDIPEHWRHVTARP
ncbi:MAG: hypothetical protein QOG15_220 [Solirubrobacteraceae bacterium]|jgi:hypothetical protein|nr:hypothetical protein [Solirubrobacteraceae bacterium]